MDEAHRRWARQRIRLLRSNPPGLAAKSQARHELVSASLNQFEALLTAAEDIGFAARPLPLFYSLSQATRAVCAVHLKSNFLLSRHGLAWPKQQGATELMDRFVIPESHATAAFTRLCDALGCDRLSEKAQLGAVWRAIPDLALPPLPAINPEWTPAWSLQPPSPEQRRHRGESVIELVVSTVDAAESTDHLKSQISRFPQLAGFEPTEVADGKPTLFPDRQGQCAALLSKPHSASLSLPGLRAAAEHLAGGFYEGDPRFLVIVPRLPAGDELAPLALWWVVLFSLSNLARYEPDTWSKALNVDRSDIAVHLEDCLTEALAVLPHLVLEALLGQRVRAGTYA